MPLDMGKQYGPLPAGAWIVVVGTGLGIALWSRRNAASAAPAVDTSGVPGVGDGSVGGWTPTGPTPDLANNTRPTTNEEWSVNAARVLMAMNYDPTLVDSMLRKYLAGQQLSVSENSLLAIALANPMIGPVPQPLPPVEGQPVPPSRTPAPVPPTSVPGPVRVPRRPPSPGAVSRPQVRRYKVAPGDSLWDISRKYYGSGLNWVSIYNANRAGRRRADGSMGVIASPNLVQPDWELVIP